jgi:hypothetical protein
MRQTLAAVALIVGSVQPAAADTHVTVRGSAEQVPVITFGDPRVGRVERASVDRLEAGRVRLSIVLATDEPTAHEVAIPIYPGSARAVALALTIDGSRLDAIALSERAARTAFHTTVEWQKDPALLERTRAGWLQLRVFPLVADHPATVEITFEPSESESRAVDAATSLYAAYLPQLLASGRVIVDGPDPDTTRRVLDAVIPTLSHCFAAGMDGFSRHSSTLHFTIDPDGRVDGIRASGVRGIDRCLRAETDRWAFTPAVQATSVRYPVAILPR